MTVAFSQVTIIAMYVCHAALACGQWKETTNVRPFSLWQLSHFDIALRLLTYIVCIIPIAILCVLQFFFHSFFFDQTERQAIKILCTTFFRTKNSNRN